MRLALTAAALTALATTCVADSAGVFRACYGKYYTEPCEAQAVWFTDGNNHGIGNFNGGCRTDGLPPHMQELCIDWGKTRLHFRFTGQGKRYMIGRSNRRVGDFCPGRSYGCELHVWEEVGCSW
ncbi:hypothetical protein B0T16DRAFT_459355 [Cercophora newfieldiana]|uniref:Uncharacterized protein n=1 Tax=Cercophora newfieldiana TaxID=92897 RepID=A0AA39Y280_9PEZI|nr:hypothetical protein B0T16DRAFT_459355 [Cercophora newfieldiana]